MNPSRDREGAVRNRVNTGCWVDRSLTVAARILVRLYSLVLLCFLAACSSHAQQAPVVPDPGFEAVSPATGFATGWTRGVGPGTQASAEIDTASAHGGSRSLRITDSTATQPYKYVLVNSDWIGVRPETTYVLSFWARGRNVGKCMAGAGFERGGEHRQPLPTGDYDWRLISIRLTVPAATSRLSIQFVADGVTDGLWIDDVRLDVSPIQLANIREARYPRPFRGWFPTTAGSMPRRLVVVDVSHRDLDTVGLLVALQGLVNRKSPRLYLINPTNPAGYDEIWFRYMREKGYTGPEERLSPEQALKRFRSVFRGLVVWDPALPGSRSAAWMLAGLEDLLPASPETAKRTGLPVEMDLRGRWRRNVDAYRFVYSRYWPRMCRHVLAWEYPLNTALSSRDYMVQHRVFMFWVSSYTDQEPGADPPAEMEFVEELLSNTPGNMPVMGWPMYVDRGVEEYTAVRLLSEYGKWVPGTGYSSNVSVISAIRPNPGVFRQKFRRAPPARPTLQRDKVYLTVNILDSGDAHWYWQFYQRLIWADPARGSVPVGYGMNVTLAEALPLVAQWYFENMTPNDSFFGFLYMNGPVYAARFRQEDRERIWREYVARFDASRRRLDMDGIEIYDGGSSGPTAPKELLRRFTRGMHGLNYILADLGRHPDVTPANAASVLDDTVVFHTLTNFRVWGTSEEVQKRTMDSENAWLIGEITANTPGFRPAFMSAMAVSWNYFPAWLKDLRSKQPADYTVVSPGELARLYRQSVKAPGK